MECGCLFERFQPPTRPRRDCVLSDIEYLHSRPFSAYYDGVEAHFRNATGEPLSAYSPPELSGSNS